MSDAHSYRGMDAAEIERQYNFRAMVPEHVGVIERWQADSARTRQRPGAVLDIPTGPHPRQRIDLFPTERGAADGKAPLLVFIHGGYWRGLSKEVFSCLADPFTARGASVALVGYGLCPEVSFDTLIDHVRGGVAWLVANGAAHGVDVGRIVLSGHSAGGHLTALLASEPGNGLAGGLCLSGIYDLEAMLPFSVNEALKLDRDHARRLSPLNRVPDGAAPPLTLAPLTLALGGDESPDMHRQQADYAAAWAKRGHAVRALAEAGTNHFTVVDRLADPSSALFAEALALLGLESHNSDN